MRLFRRLILSSLLSAGACAATAAAQVSTSALAGQDEPPALSSQSGRQTGVATYEHDGRQVIIRSYEPRTVSDGRYRVDFAALDADGDGYVSRAEARAHPALDAEFRAIDVNRDGRLSREELAGWLR